MSSSSHPSSGGRSSAAHVGRSPSEPGVAFSAVFCALIVAASNLSAISAETAFVGASSSRELAAFGVASAAARSLVALALAALAQRTSRGVVSSVTATRFEVAFLVASATSLLAAALALRSGSHGAMWLACLVPSTLAALAPVVAFQSVSSSVGPRRARVLLPKLAAASTVGSIAAGAVASRLGVATASIGFVVAGGAFVASALLPGRLHVAQAVTSDAGRGERAAAASLRSALGSPIARVVVAFAVASAALAATVDLAFKLALQAAGDRAAIGPTLAVSHVASNVLVLGLQLFATTRLVERVGMRGALGAAGVSSLVLGPLVAIAPGVMTSLGLRFTEGAARYALGTQVSDLLLTAAPAATRARVKALSKGLAGPVGALVAGGLAAMAVALAGGVRTLGIAAALLGGVVLAIASAAPRAYADALRITLKRAAVPLDDAAVGAHRAAVLGRLRHAVGARDLATCHALLDLADPRFFHAADLAPFLATPVTPIRRALLESLSARREEASATVLLATAVDADPALEAIILSALRARGVRPPIGRLRHALQHGRERDDDPAARLFAEGALGVVLFARAEPTPELEREGRVALAELRRAARGPTGVVDDGGPRRVRALAALAVLADPKAEREVQLGLSTSHPEVFAEAARAGLAIEAPGVVATLVRALRSGPYVRIAGRALRAARRRAVNELLAALPVTRGEGGVVVTAAASARTVTGTVRAAHVVAHLGPEGAIAALERLDDLGFRARDAVVRAVARSAHAAQATEQLLRAAARFTAIGHGLMHVRAQGGYDLRGLYGREIDARLAIVRERLIDIAGVLDASGALRRGRGVIDAGGVRAEAALELIDASLGRDLGPRAIAVLTGTVLAETPEALPMDGWLGRIRAFEAGELPSTDPMRDVLDRVRVLHGVPLFAALSAEELYPVAEVAERVIREAGERVVAQGDPSDALFVVAEGRCEVVRDGVRLSEIGSGAAFGELGVLDGEPRSATVTALVPTTLLRIPRDELEALLDESPDVARSIIRHLVAFARERAGAPDRPPQA